MRGREGLVADTQHEATATDPLLAGVPLSIPISLREPTSEQQIRLRPPAASSTGGGPEAGEKLQ